MPPGLIIPPPGLQRPSNAPRSADPPNVSRPVNPPSADTGTGETPSGSDDDEEENHVPYPDDLPAAWIDNSPPAFWAGQSPISWADEVE